MLGKISLTREMTKIMRKYKHEKDGYFYIIDDLITAREIINELKAIKGLSLSTIHDCKGKEIKIANKQDGDDFRIIHYKIGGDTVKAKRNIDITFYIKELNYASSLHFRKMVGRDWVPANDPSFELTYDEVIEAIHGLIDKLDNGDRIKIEFDREEVTKEFLEKCLQDK